MNKDTIKPLLAACITILCLLLLVGPVVAQVSDPNQPPIEPGPFISEVAPNLVGNTEATEITISGGNFGSSVSATLIPTTIEPIIADDPTAPPDDGNQPEQQMVFELEVLTATAEKISAMVPAGLPAGTYDLTISSSTGEASLPIGLTIVDGTIPPDGPFISEVAPNLVGNTEATEITISGGNFGEQVRAVLTHPVIFPEDDTSPPTGEPGRTEQVSYDLTIIEATPEQILASLPAGLPAGLYDLTVSSSTGEASLPIGLTIVDGTIPPGGPYIIDVYPNVVGNSTPTDIVISGGNFGDNVIVMLGDTILEVRPTIIPQPWGDEPAIDMPPEMLYAVVPAGMQPGVYDLMVSSSTGRALLPAAVTVLDDSIVGDDLYGLSSEFWANPGVARVGEPVELGLIVRRAGGQRVLENVQVEIMVFQPDGQAITLISSVPFLDPFEDADGILPVSFTPATSGTYFMQAFIDYDNQVSEITEENNIVERKISVVDGGEDSTPPVVEDITVNDGSSETDNGLLDVAVSASDPQPAASGVQAAYLIEYAYYDSIAQWVPVQQQNTWLPYTTTPMNYTWNLLPTPGMRYMTVRVRDGADNISIGRPRALINYLPEADSMEEGQTRVYRYPVPPGQRLAVQLDIASGDADLYVWSSDGISETAVVSNQESGDDYVTLVNSSTEEQVYQIEVHSYTAAEFSLSVETAPAGAGLQGAASLSNLSDQKTLLQDPVLPLSSLPEENLPADSLPPLPALVSTTVYLPVIRR